jgi:hypothetical protein
VADRGLFSPLGNSRLDQEGAGDIGQTPSHSDEQWRVAIAQGLSIDGLSARRRHWRMHRQRSAFSAPIDEIEIVPSMSLSMSVAEEADFSAGLDRSSD